MVLPCGFLTLSFFPSLRACIDLPHCISSRLAFLISDHQQIIFVYNEVG